MKVNILFLSIYVIHYTSIYFTFLGISLNGTSFLSDMEFGLDFHPNSDDVVASFLLQRGLFTFGLLGHRTTEG